ncbi:MAG: hypothetical protein C3F13_12825 [Anaerolineales bacterium]|nr:PKD domain-containing protein [Anaerolineae bacterium]PWB51787.1 MAG: hypothetical protein C3F13_12825 [Anaerolineales bacterium]
MTSKHRFLIAAIVMAVVILIGGLFLDQNRRTSASELPTTDISLGVTKSDQLVIRFYYDSQDQLNAVAGLLDTWEVHPLPRIGSNAGYAIAAVYPSQMDWLESLGYRVEVDQEYTALLQSSLAPLDPRYYYFDNYVTNGNDLYMVDFMRGISDTYSSIAELIDIGNAWQAAQGGHIRDMWVMRITSENPNFGPIEDKPAFFLFANVHAREVTTPEMAIRYIKYLTSGYLSQGGYEIDPDVTWLVNHHAVYILVSQNPDGHAINEANWSLYRRKNMDTAGCTYDPNNWGVDLNRNSSFKWGCCGGSSGSPCAETYRGPTRNSEPETQAFQTFFASIFPDQNGNNGDDQIPGAAPNNATGIFLSLHSYGDEVLWPWGFDDSLNPPNGAQLTTIGRKLAYLTSYYPLHNLYTVDGDNADWVYGKFGVPAFTYEIGADSGTCGNFFPSYTCQDGEGVPRNFWAENRPSFIYLHKIARTPYLTAYGPDSNSLSVTPASVIAGDPVELTAYIRDYRYAGDPAANIGGAEFFIDTEGTDGAGIALSPSDGSWGGSFETVESIVDTTDLSVGQHYILVHGRNVNGDWGPFTAIFLTIAREDAPTADFTSNSPVVLGEEMLFTNTTTGTEPITYEWDFGDGVTTTEVSPVHLYLGDGDFIVTLVATNTYGTDEISILVSVFPPAPIADFTSNSPVEFGEQVVFTNTTTGTGPITYEWDFGDGIGTSTETNPTYLYTAPGIFTVTLVATNPGGSDLVTQLVIVNKLKIFIPISSK